MSPFPVVRTGATSTPNLWRTTLAAGSLSPAQQPRHVPQREFSPLTLLLLFSVYFVQLNCNGGLASWQLLNPVLLGNHMKTAMNLFPPAPASPRQALNTFLPLIHQSTAAAVMQRLWLTAKSHKPSLMYRRLFRFLIHAISTYKENEYLWENDAIAYRVAENLASVNCLKLSSLSINVDLLQINIS